MFPLRVRCHEQIPVLPRREGAGSASCRGTARAAVQARTAENEGFRAMGRQGLRGRGEEAARWQGTQEHAATALVAEGWEGAQSTEGSRDPAADCTFREMKPCAWSVPGFAGFAV